MCDVCVCVCVCVRERERERVCARECVLCVCVRASVCLTAAVASHERLYACIQNDGASVWKFPLKEPYTRNLYSAKETDI